MGAAWAGSLRTGRPWMGGQNNGQNSGQITAPTKQRNNVDVGVVAAITRRTIADVGVVAAITQRTSADVGYCSNALTRMLALLLQ